ncbi:MAG: tetratricopeptide repeat protein [Pyrinomonadaceae bacterium]
MIFDKTKAMRSAERFLAQGKIRAAIGEYELVVKHDPKDFGTLNILGDLYIKSSEKPLAIPCYTKVAEHYAELGFAQKAIAVYNKIAKVDPTSLAVSAKLAELYKLKGSVREARSHYVTLAEHYQKAGKKVEALAIWEQIALLDPTNTAVFLNIAGSYLEENQPDGAIEAYTECGNRFTAQKKHEEALDCFAKALDIRADDPRALAGFVATKFSQNQPQEAARSLEILLEKQPFNREIIHLLIDCYLSAGDTAAAERTVIRLAEHEPANYPKFLELASIYLEKNDLASTGRILTMSAEHMLVGGQAKEFNGLVREVLSRDPDHLEALRLLVKYCAWQRDEKGFREALVRLAEIAQTSGCIEDERYALAQLTVLMPQEIGYADRLRQINEENGFEDPFVAESLFDKQFFKEKKGILPIVNGNGSGNGTANGNSEGNTPVEFELVPGAEENASATDQPEAEGGEALDAEVIQADQEEDLRPASEIKLFKEIESIRFYVDSGYLELAEKAINELRGEYAERPEVIELEEYFKNGTAIAATEIDPVIPVITGSFDLGELRSELGLEEADVPSDSDYETHYQTAVAYQEMGLVEQAIHEFQEAVNCIPPNDGTRRFFQCANLLGHCFMQQGMPKLALKWFDRTLETVGLDEEEKQALWYEVGAAYEMDGDIVNAAKYFEYVYAENVDFRDVRNRMKSFMVSH